MEEDQARSLHGAGVGWVNHNLNTSERFHPEICTTHAYADRVRTVENARRAGLSTCCGGIIGMGESDEDVVDLAFALRALQVDSLPVNFLIPIAGTPLADRRELTPARCLKALCLFRFTNPKAEIRVAGGRELNLGWFQPLALHVANSIFVDGYLTTPGQAHNEARRMVEEMGFEVEVQRSVVPA
jgi:biotin synthase